MLILSTPAGQRLQVLVVKFHAVVERTHPHALVLTMRPHVVLVKRDT